MSSQKIGIGLLDITDENTLITNQWLELLVARGNGMQPETGPQWGALPAKALELSHKVDALRTRQDQLRQDLDRAIDVLARDLPCPSEAGVGPCSPAFARASRNFTGSDSFFKGIARKLFSGKAIH